MIDFDVILEQIGGLGRYQIMLVVMVCYYSIPSGINSLAPVFMNYKPDFRCNVPPIDNASAFPHLTEEDILNITTPLDDDTNEYDTCRRYVYDPVACTPENIDHCVNTTLDPVACDMGYHYDTSIFPRTAVTEFDLVCERSILDPLATSIYMVGVLIGSSIFGMLADKLGRKLVMIFSCVISFGALIGCSFVHTYWLFVLCRFLVALFGFGSFLTSFVYLMEIVSSKYRTPIGVSFQVFFAVGYMILSGVAYQWRDWHEMNLVTGLIGLPYAVFLFFIPESPRWLFSNGEYEKAKEITRKFAKFNRVQLDEKCIWEDAEKSAAVKEKEAMEVGGGRSYTIADLFKTKGTRIITLKLMFIWFVNSLIYYGISLNAGSLAGDIFLNNTLNGVMEIASYIIVILTMDRIGRRWIMSIMLILSCLGLVCSAIVTEYATNETLDTVSLVFSFIGKIGASGSYAVLYNFTSELYPTVIRSNGIGLSSTAARFGGILAPLVIAVQGIIQWLPNIIFGVLAAITAGVSLMLPETSNINMMETIVEAEEFYNSGRTNDSEMSTKDGSHQNDGFEVELSSKL